MILEKSTWLSGVSPSEAQCIGMDLRCRLVAFLLLPDPCSPCLEYLQDVGPFVRGLGDLIGWLSGERRNEVFHI